jgi:hypothetical protein
MRWDGLFADLEAQAAAFETAERAIEVDERARAEVAYLRLRDRLRPAVGLPVRIRSAAGASAAGTLTRVGSQWLLVDEPAGREAVVVIAAIISVSGLGRLSATPDSEGVVESRLGLTHVLRGVARNRSAVRIHLVDASILDGTIDRVGADFVELAAHAAGELRRRAAVRDVVLVAISAIVMVRRDGERV